VIDMVSEEEIQDGWSDVDEGKEFFKSKSDYELREIIAGGAADGRSALEVLIDRTDVGTLIGTIKDAPCFLKKEVVDDIIEKRGGEFSHSQLEDIIYHLAGCLK